MALSLTILMLFLALGSGTAVWAAEATGSSTLEQHLEKKYVTQQDLQSAPHNVETEDAAIPAKYFEFVCVNHHADGSACTDLQTDALIIMRTVRPVQICRQIPFLRSKVADYVTMCR